MLKETRGEVKYFNSRPSARGDCKMAGRCEKHL